MTVIVPLEASNSGYWVKQIGRHVFAVRTGCCDRRLKLTEDGFLTCPVCEAKKLLPDDHYPQAISFTEMSEASLENWLTYWCNWVREDVKVKILKES